MQVRIEWIAGIVVAAGLGVFLLFVLSPSDVVEEEDAQRRVASAQRDPRPLGFATDPQRGDSARSGKPDRRIGTSDSGRRAGPPRGADDVGSGSGPGGARSRRQDPAPSVEAGDEIWGATGRRNRPGGTGGGRVTLGRDERAGRSGGAGRRRGDLVEFLASKRLSPEDEMSGKVGEDGEAVALDGDEGEDDVLLSVPLLENTEAEGYTQPIAEEGIHPNAEGGVEFPEDSVLAFPDAGNMRGDSGTIALEIEPNWNGTDPGDNSFVQVRDLDAWQGKLSLFRNGSGLRFVIVDADGQEYGAVAPISDWQAGDRHTVTATWDSGDGILSLYVDGVVAEQTSFSGNLDIPPGTPLFLGSNPRNHVPGAGATLQNFKVYGRALSPEEVSAGGASSGGDRPSEER